MESSGAVVIGGYVNGLGLVRALAARGVPTAVVTTQPFDIAHRSRASEAVDHVRGLDERPEPLVELLERRAPGWRGRVVIPTNDEALAALAEYHERLSSLYRLASPTPDVTACLLDKSRLEDAAEAVGADVPRSYGPADSETAERPDLEFPVLVKPLAGYRFAARFGAKVLVARDRDGLRRCVARVSATGIPARIVELVPGPDSQIYAYGTYVDARGEPVPGVMIRKLRQSPPGFGVARVAEVVETIPNARDLTVELVRRIGLRGMAVAEFKLDDRDGSLRFIEINGRSVVYNALIQRAGLDLAGLAWSDYAGGSLEAPEPNGWRGTWINLHADVLYSALERRNGRVGPAGFLAPYRRRWIEAVWSVHDPLPFVVLWLRTARRGAAALLAGRQPWNAPEQADATARNFRSP